jgi:hypothetical protein
MQKRLPTATFAVLRVTELRLSVPEAGKRLARRFGVSGETNRCDGV